MEQINDSYLNSELPDRYKLALKLADAVISNPSGLTEFEQAQLRNHFTATELAELALTVAMAAGFSKAAVAWGPPPPIPVTEVPTPTPTGSVT